MIPCANPTPAPPLGGGVPVENNQQRVLCSRSRVCVACIYTRARVNESLLHKVAAGDAGAVKELTRRYAGLVYALARRMCLSQNEVEDAVQDIFIALWQSAARYNPAIAGEDTFVAMVARRRLIDRRRKSVRRRIEQGTEDFSFMTSDETLASAPGAGAELSEDARMAAAMLQTLRPEQQQVLRLAVGQGYSHEQISGLLDLPLGTVKTHVRRGLISLRSALQKHRSGANPNRDSGEGTEDRQA